MIDIPALASDVLKLCDGHEGRFLLGIAGAPASGKSTTALALAEALPDAVNVPMDGYHLDDAILNARGHRPRKGAPHTFDVAGFCALLKRLRAEPEVFAPEFDRTLELARAARIEVAPEHRIVVIEGNYLLHDEGGWEHVRPLLDACWFLDVPEDVLRARLEERWTIHDLPRSEWGPKIDGNDLPNARLVMATRDRADRVLTF